MPLLSRRVNSCASAKSTIEELIEFLVEGDVCCVLLRRMNVGHDQIGLMHS